MHESKNTYKIIVIASLVFVALVLSLCPAFLSFEPSRDLRLEPKNVGRIDMPPFTHDIYNAMVLYTVKTGKLEQNDFNDMWWKGYNIEDQKRYWAVPLRRHIVYFIVRPGLLKPRVTIKVIEVRRWRDGTISYDRIDMHDYNCDMRPDNIPTDRIITGKDSFDIYSRPDKTYGNRHDPRWGTALSFLYRQYYAEWTEDRIK